MKMLTATSALQHQVVTPSTRINDTAVLRFGHGLAVQLEPGGPRRACEQLGEPALVDAAVLLVPREADRDRWRRVSRRAPAPECLEIRRVGSLARAVDLLGRMHSATFDHRDYHGGNLLVLPDGRTGLLDFGITGRLPENQRLAFLRLLVGASMNDVVTQLGALRDLGALPPDADLPRIIAELGLDRPPVDPTTLTAEELTGEIQRIMKALLAYGARLPKPLMLFVKNLVFLDGAIATLAPDLDLFAEITAIATYFTLNHGERIADEVGLAAEQWDLDLIADECPPLEATDPTLAPNSRVAARKTLGLAEAIKRYGFQGIIAGIRRDEQATRAKERVFSPRAESGAWNFRDQPPEFWDHFKSDLPEGAHMRIHPLLSWTELDIWRYIAREQIPIVDLYYARDGKRYRSLGDQDITSPIASNAP